MVETYDEKFGRKEGKEENEGREKRKEGEWNMKLAQCTLEKRGRRERKRWM